MAERSNGSLAHALREGIARAASAPAVVLGTFAAARILDVPSASPALFDRGARPVLIWLLFWSLAYGGVVDRLARDRPTRAYGFFAACGAHLMPLLRLGAVVLAAGAVWVALVPEAPATPAGRAGLLAIEAIAAAIVAFARVRLVVEDRRSALGAIAAAIRFMRRNPSAVVLIVLYVAAAAGVDLGYAGALGSGAIPDDWRGRISNEAFLFVHFALKIAAYAAAVALFQGRLAHAGYTAAPPAEWPESASAEAIANASPRLAP